MLFAEYVRGSRGFRGVVRRAGSQQFELIGINSYPKATQAVQEAIGLRRTLLRQPPEGFRYVKTGT